MCGLWGLLLINKLCVLQLYFTQIDEHVIDVNKLINNCNSCNLEVFFKLSSLGDNQNSTEISNDRDILIIARHYAFCLFIIHFIAQRVVY